MPTIRPARADEAALVSALAIRSKAHWGYDEAAMRIFREELTLTPQALCEGDGHVIESDAGVQGFYTLTPHEAGRIELEHLFVEPDALRQGLGRRLLDHALERARRAGARRMTVQSDPHAAGFYEAAGFVEQRRIPTSIPGRTLPLLERVLS